MTLNLVVNKMAQLTVISCLTAASGFIYAGNDATCTTAPKNTWVDKKTAESQISSEGYTIKSLKSTSTCYKMKGANSKGEKGYYYFDPVTLKLVQFDIEGWTDSKKS